MAKANKTYSAGEEDSMKLTCGRNLKSNPSAIIRWTHPKGEPVTSSERFTMNNGPEEVSLEIANVGKDDNGTWTCTVEVPRNNSLYCNSDSEQERVKELELQLIVVSKLKGRILLCVFNHKLSLYIMQFHLVNHEICMWRK